MTDAGIAEALGISAGAVKSHLHRARATLAGRLEDLR
jgi:DNA-directed RNA polymerase specialized sigma24 family protein